jgi:hypothetical protein
MRLNRQQLHELRAGRKPCLYTKDHPGYEVGLNRKVTNVDERVIVLEVAQVKVAELTGQHARMAGFESRAELMQSLGYHPEGPRAELGFEVWETVLRRDISHRPRLLHRKLHRGYTTNPFMADREVGEAVESDYDERFRADADMHAGQQAVIYQAAWDAQSLAQRVQRLVADPNTSREQLRSLEQRILQLERRAQRKAA